MASKNDISSPSRIVGKTPENTPGTIAQEVAAQISLPIDGGWGWMVVFSAFTSIFILDGVCFTFGSLHTQITNDLQASASLVALINSTAVSLYFLASPMASALINRYGFRECAMCGSIICSLSLFISYFVNRYSYLLLFYGITAGFGYSLINMSSGLVVGFYFEKLRSVALAVATCGSSLGVMAMFPLNTFLVEIGGWRPTTLIHSGLFGIIFFLGMAYRPLVSVTVTNTEEEATRTIAYLPSVMSMDFRKSTSAKTVLAPSRSERLFSAVSNANFPTAAAVVDKSPTIQSPSASQPGPSKVGSFSNKITLTANPPEGGFSSAQIKYVQSFVSKASENIESTITVQTEPENKVNDKGIFHWEPHPSQSRPLYRDDAFYEGNLTRLPQYQKIPPSGTAPSGLEYQMAVTRATAIEDLNDNRRVFTTAMRRVMATIMDISLLKRGSFLLMCCSGFLTYLGFLVPYVYLKERNIKAGIDPKHCNLFISAIGLSNAFGRLILGSLASKVDPLKLFSFWCSMAGVSTIVSSLSYNLYYQYVYCCVFGFAISSVACLRSLILVSLYGLDKLTNATGMMLIFLGLGNLGSTPLAGVIIDKFGYTVAFYVSGSFITISGLVLIPVKVCALREGGREAKKQPDAKGQPITRQQIPGPKDRPTDKTTNTPDPSNERNKAHNYSNK